MQGAPSEGGVVEVEGVELEALGQVGHTGVSHLRQQQ